MTTHIHARTRTEEVEAAVHYQHRDCRLVSLSNCNKSVVKRSVCLLGRLAKSAAALLTTNPETSIFGGTRQFLLIACKGRRQNLKNDCPHTEILPYRRQHLEDTRYFCWNQIVLNALSENLRRVRRTSVHLSVVRVND